MCFDVGKTSFMRFSSKALFRPRTSFGIAGSTTPPTTTEAELQQQEISPNEITMKRKEKLAKSRVLRFSN
jgi:hypothetical protein